MAHTKMAINEGMLQSKPATAAEAEARKGLEFQRKFTDGKVSPFDTVEWERRVALIGNEKGKNNFPPGKCGSAEGLVADRDKHRRVEIFSTASSTRLSAKVPCASSSAAW